MRLAFVSHELRNPLSNVQLAAAMLERDRSEETRERATRLIQRSATRLSKVVDDLIDVTRLDSNMLRIDRKTLRLQDSILAAADAAAPAITQRQQYFAVDVRLVPIAFADKDGWPAMGTFDIVNMRVNGYDFHISLMAGKESWTDPKVKQVFDTWRGLLEHHQPGANGRTWQEAAQSLQQKKTGMYLLGMFVAQQFPESDLDDLDFFAFPEINPQFGQDSVEAPIDGYMISAKAKNVDGAKQLLKHLASAASQNVATKLDPGTLAASSKADASGYSALQKRGAELVSQATHISQFLDRDTRPDFASTVMIPSLQRFIGKPDDIDALLKDIEAQKTNIFQ